MKIKEDIRFRLAPDDDDHLFMIKSKSVFEFRGRHEVLNADGAVIGMLEKDFGGRCCVATGTCATRRERSSSRRTRRAGSSRSCGGSQSSARTVFAAEWLPFDFVYAATGSRPGLQARARQVPRPLRPRARTRAQAARPPARRRVRGRAGRAPGSLVAREELPLRRLVPSLPQPRMERGNSFHLVDYSSSSKAAERPRVNASAYHVTKRHAATAVVAMPAANAPYRTSLTKRSPASRPRARKAVPTRNNQCPTRTTSDLPPRRQRSRW